MSGILCLLCKQLKQTGDFAPSQIYDDETGRCRQCRSAKQKQRRHELGQHRSKRDIALQIVCSICQQEKLSSEYRFSSAFGFKTECKECEKTQLRCGQCKNVKPIDCFSKDPNVSTGRYNICTGCRSVNYQASERRPKKVYQRPTKQSCYGCSVCNQEKPADQFRWNSYGGMKTECMECEKTQLRCTRCELLKAHGLFSLDPKISTGRSSICLECRKIEQKGKWNDPEFRKQRKQWSQSPAGKESRNRYIKNNHEAYRKSQNATKKKLYDNNPTYRTKVLARQAVRMAVLERRLIKPDRCQADGRYGNNCCHSPVEGHHCAGYDQEHWLNVEWLCRNCHAIADLLMREAGLAIPNDVVDWQNILRVYGFRCAYCGRGFSVELPPTQDHVIPKIRGGRHDNENVIPACLGCNREKHDFIIRKPLPGHPESVQSLLFEAYPPVSSEPEKRQECLVCHVEKPLSQFRYNSQSGLRTECVECEKYILRCSMCKLLKTHDQFANDSKILTGKKSNCRECANGLTAKHRAKSEVKILVKQKRHDYRKRDNVKQNTKVYMESFTPSTFVPVVEKLCSKCKEVKQADKFGSNKNTKDRLASWCRACVRDKVAAKRAVDKVICSV